VKKSEKKLTKKSKPTKTRSKEKRLKVNSKVQIKKLIKSDKVSN
jgi:hypothetical protein